MSEPEKDKSPKSIIEKIQRQFLEERKIFFWGEVNDKSCSDVAQKLFYLESLDSEKEIKFYINSPGGSTTAGLALYDTMRLLKSPISTIVVGMAASMGSILLCAGRKGRRFIYPHGKVLIHQPWIAGKIIAPALDISIHAQNIESTRQELNRILAEASGQSLERVQNDTDRDFQMDAKASIAYGLVDGLVTSLEM
jgi:ATP-dependent Clp protease protease subunit